MRKKAAPPAPPPDAYAAISDADLARRGLPRALVPALRAIVTAADLEALLSCVRVETAAALAELAAGALLVPGEAVDAVPAPAPAVAPAPPPPGGGADVALDDLLLSARINHWAERRGLSTLREVARISPAALRGERNLGRRSFAEIRAAIAEHLGAPWETFSRGQGVEEPTTTAPEEDGPPPAVPDLALDDLDLPTRMANWARLKGLSTLRELARISPQSLLAEKNLGRRSVLQTRVVIEPRLGCTWERAAGSRTPQRARREAIEAAARQLAERQQALAVVPLLDAWRSQLLELAERERAVMVARAGLDGDAARLRAIAVRLGLPRTTVRRFERRAIYALRRRRAWLAVVRARAEAALSSHRGAAPLSTLAEDPWWTGITALPHALDYFGRQALQGAWRVVRIEERPYLARCPQRVLDEARAALHAAAAQVSLPAPLATFRALLDPWEPRIHAGLAEALFERLHADLLVDEAGDAPRVTARATSQKASLLAALQASPVPLHVADKHEGAQWLSMSGDVLRLGRGVLGLPRHFPSYEAWRELLVPAAIRVMVGGPPERQWLARELHAQLAEALDIPAWLTEWHLGSLLARSGKVRYLGQMRVALPGAPEAQGSVTVGKELVRILRARGAPMMRGELIEELRRKMGANDAAFSLGLRHEPIVRLERGCYGLVDRDLPGRARARAKARDHAAALLAQRGLGLGAGALQQALAALSPAHARWTPAMHLTALRGDPRFQQSASGAVGLASWEGVRVPSREDLARACLKKGRGRVRVSTVARRIEEIYGEAPTQKGMWALAFSVRASMGEGWLKARKAEPNQAG